MPEIKLPVGGIVVTIDELYKTTGELKKRVGHITSELHEEYTPDDPDNPDPDEEQDFERYNAAIDGLESLILAHACAGVDIADPKYVEGIQTAIDAIANWLD